MALYRTSLENVVASDSFNMTFTAGDLSLYCTFSWPTVNQEQYDAFTRELNRMVEGDPLRGKDSTYYNRVYDYIDYYLQFKDMLRSEIIDYVNNAEELPLSLWKRRGDDVNIIRVISTRLSTCVELDEYRLLFKECGVWLMTLSYQGDTRTARVIPGGWSHNQDDTFKFRFTSDKETIGYDDLPFVNFEVETP